MALFYEIELKIQTRMCNCTSMGRLIKWHSMLPFIWLHLLGEEHAGTCPFGGAQQNWTRDSQISGWRKILCKELGGTPQFLKWEQLLTYTVQDILGNLWSLNSRYTALQHKSPWISFFICQMELMTTAGCSVKMKSNHIWRSCWWTR